MYATSNLFATHKSSFTMELSFTKRYYKFCSCHAITSLYTIKNNINIYTIINIYTYCTGNFFLSVAVADRKQDLCAPCDPCSRVTSLARLALYVVSIANVNVFFNETYHEVSVTINRKVICRFIEIEEVISYLCGIDTRDYSRFIFLTQCTSICLFCILFALKVF